MPLKERYYSYFSLQCRRLLIHSCFTLHCRFSAELSFDVDGQFASTVGTQQFFKMACLVAIYAIFATTAMSSMVTQLLLPPL